MIMQGCNAPIVGDNTMPQPENVTIKVELQMPNTTTYEHFSAKQKDLLKCHVEKIGVTAIS
jgi:hypothetical protein